MLQKVSKQTHNQDIINKGSFTDTVGRRYATFSSVTLQN